MRVREVMSGPVVCVPPEMPLKEVADLLVTRAISAVPVVEDGELVGILSEADLVPLELAPDPRAHLIPQTDAPAHLPKLAGEAKHSTDPKVGVQLLDAIAEIDKIFWDTKLD